MGNVFDIVIIGGGASGLFCAASPDLRGLRGLLLEGSRAPGQKLLMSGGGRCNITHAGDIRAFLTRYGSMEEEELLYSGKRVRSSDRAGSRVRSALYRYSNESLVRFLEDHGLTTFCQEDGRIFPRSERASDVRDLLVRLAEENGMRIGTGCRVTGIRPGEGGVTVFYEEDGRKTSVRARRLVAAGGGASYPATGSDGGLLKILKRDLGIGSTDLKPALAPPVLEGYPYGSLSGISTERVRIRVLAPSGKKIFETWGPVLLTEKGFSGPAVLNASSWLRPEGWLEFSWICRDYEETAEEVMEALRGVKAEAAANLLSRRFGLPRKFARVLTERAGGLSPKKIARLLTADRFLCRGNGSFRQAMATRGGIPLTAADLKTFRLKDWPEVSVIGEGLDLDGETGGYNLQFAYSSARAAACEIGTELYRIQENI